MSASASRLATHGHVGAAAGCAGCPTPKPRETLTIPTRNLRLEPLPGLDAAVGAWLAALQESRDRTKARIGDLPPTALDRTGDSMINSIGTLLAHIAAIEMDWLSTEIREPEIPAEVRALLPEDVRDQDGRLWPVVGLPLAEHLRRLDETRAILLARVVDMDAADLHRVRHLDRYDITPAWV